MVAMYAHRAYKEPIFFDTAVSIWEAATESLITQKENDSGRHPLKDVPFGCNNSEY